MDENTLSPDNLATLSLFRNGADGRRYDTGGRFANSSSIQHGQAHINSNVSCEGDKTRINTNGKADQLFAGMEDLARTLSFNRTNDKIDHLAGEVVNSERRVTDRQRDTDAIIAANAKEAALCCCNLAKQACEDKAQILAAIAAQGAETITRELNQANAEIMFLRSQHHHRP